MPASPDRLVGPDPRTTILLVGFVAVVVMLPQGLPFVLPSIALGVALAVASRAPRRVLGLVTATLLLWLLGWRLPLWWPSGLSAALSAASVYLMRFLAVAAVGSHLVMTTSPTQLGAALRAARVPRALTVTLTVMVRLLPVVAAETVAVLDAMRLRGLTGAKGVLRHPVRAAERFTVPMIASSLRASDDLAASAVLRGLGSRRTPTALVPPRLGRADLATAMAVVGLVVVALALPSPLG